MNNFKILMIVISFFTISQNSFSQSDSTKPFNYLFQKGIIGIYAGPYFRYTNIDGNFTDISGGGGGIYLYNRIFIAGSSFGQWNPGKSETLPDRLIALTMNGVTIGANTNPENIIHFNGGLFLGFGKATITKSDTKEEVGSMNITFLAPMLDAEINVYEAFRFFVGCDYRFAFSNDEYLGLNSDKFKGFSIFWGIKTGLF